MTALALTMAALTDQCRHSQPTIRYVACYCLGLSVVFVGALYLLIPPSARELERDDARQIRWRIFAVVVVCVVSTVTYPAFFCDLSNDSEQATMNSRSALELMGWTSDHIRAIFGVLLHVSLLYTGPILASLLYVRSVQERMQTSGSSISYMEAFYRIQIDPIVSPVYSDDASQRWSQVRNVIMAPMTEEIVFRGCMVSPLLSAGLQPLTASFVVPLFFGTAHVHHAFLKLKQGNSLSRVVLMATFQLAYTMLFGAYAAYAFIRTGSIVAIAFGHSFCNCMGLPDLSFLRSHGTRLSCIHDYHQLILGAYLIGMIAFAYGFQWNMTLPAPLGRLVDYVRESLIITKSS